MRHLYLFSIALLSITLFIGCGVADDASGDSNNYYNQNNVNNANNVNNGNNVNTNNSNNSNNLNNVNSTTTEPPEEFDPSNWPPETCEDNGPTTLYLSADDSNSQASPAYISREILSGHYVNPAWVRPWEFLNYATFDYEAPDSGLALYPELRPSSDASGLYTLQIGVRSPDRSREEMRPMNLVLVLDSSGSMAGEAIELLKESVSILFDSLGDDDRVSIVRMSAIPTVLSENLAPLETDLDSIFTQLRPDGITNLSTALSRAYNTATAHYDASRMNRVVLFTDGAANAGETDVDLIKAQAGVASEEGIHLMGVGLGESFNDRLLDRLTDAGKGAFIFIDSPQEAHRQFEDNFVSNFDVAALNVRVRMVLPSTFSVVKFHGEEISTDPQEVTPQNLAPSDQMIFNQLIGTCDPDATTGTESFEVSVSWTDALERTTFDATVTFTLNSLMEAPAPNLAKGNALVGYAETLKKLYDLRYGGHDAEITELCQAQAALFSEAPQDEDITSGALLMSSYCNTVRQGESHEGSCDGEPDASFAQALGLCTTEIPMEVEDLGVGTEGVR
ncbi:VWA domain-containing protein, partial [Myxococcota bacterium]|nr:VWA domain-containing protein [Myxococcota bacterium]MBU1536024.1 VWA domain-containing protein [Myxococcota bacterium]